MDTVNGRLKILAETLFDGNISEFGRAINVKQATLSTILGSRQSKPSFDIINAIAVNISNINTDWLITGEGEMLKSEASHKEKAEDSRTDPISLERLIAIIESQQRTIEILSNKLK